MGKSEPYHVVVLDIGLAVAMCARRLIPLEREPRRANRQRIAGLQR